MHRSYSVVSIAIYSYLDIYFKIMKLYILGLIVKGVELHILQVYIASTLQHLLHDYVLSTRHSYLTRDTQALNSPCHGLA